MSNESRKRASSSQVGRNKNKRGALIAIVALLGMLGLCTMITIGSAIWLYNVADDSLSQPEPEEGAAANWAPDSAELTIAVSPLMADVMSELADSFNAQQQRTPDDKTMSVAVMPIDPQHMVQEAISKPAFQAISPDSSLWLDRLEMQWAERSGEIAGSAESGQVPIGQRRTAEQMRYAISPIVIAAWESVARELGWPEKQIGWQDIQELGAENPDFKWSHPSTQHASGLLATLAIFYAGSGMTRGLTVEAATEQTTLDYVQEIESTVRFYGEDEQVITERLAAEGRAFLDAFVAQERMVIDWNRNHSGEKLVALYPKEGSSWTDHPLALLELGQTPDELAVTDNQRATYRAFANYLASTEAQSKLLSSGYRPADLAISLDNAESPFANTDAVDWREPQTTLQIPSPPVVEVVLNAWYYTKRPTNVYLVVDTSGSMDGEKLARAKEALSAFVTQIQGARDRVGIVEFGSGVKSFRPLESVSGDNRQTTISLINNMNASGGTALLDAVYQSTASLLSLEDSEAINAIVVMTDGLENESSSTLADLEQLMSRTRIAPVIFTVAFGDDADEEMLSEIAAIGGGQFRRADETDIEELYRVISTYF
jgi:Ca-activated chloride channel family protein